MTTKRHGRDEKPHVFTKKEAWMLLAAASDYAHSPDRTIGGKDRAEILAEATLTKGHSDLSDTISRIHSSVTRFHKGEYKAIQYLLETPAISEVVKQEAKGTGIVMVGNR